MPRGQQMVQWFWHVLLMAGMFPRDGEMVVWCRAGTPGNRHTHTNRGPHLEWVPRSLTSTMTEVAGEVAVDPDRTLSVVHCDNRYDDKMYQLFHIMTGLYLLKYIPSYPGYVSDGCSRRICLRGLKFGSLNPVKYLSVTVCPNLTILRCLHWTNLTPIWIDVDDRLQKVPKTLNNFSQLKH